MHEAYYLRVERASKILNALNTLATQVEGGSPSGVMIMNEGDQWTLTVNGSVFFDTSLMRVIERAARRLTTEFDR